MSDHQDRPELSQADKDKLLDHEYDGIRELDHPLPRWWLGTFALTILFGVPYFVYYVWGGGPTLMEEHQISMKSVNERRALAAQAASEFDPALFDKIKAEGGVDKGKVVFETNCTACHKDQGIGDIGPNLTDAFWIHGQGLSADLYKVVFNGVEDMGMPVWKEMLSKEEIYQVVAYVGTLRNLNLKGKEPQGQKVQE